MLKLTRREQVLVACFLVLILVLSGIYMYGRPGLASDTPLPLTGTESRQESTIPQKSDTNKPTGEVKVDVKGAVNVPGVYSLPAGSRVVDAIQAAGGTTDQADLEAVNLAQKLVDGGFINIPSKNDPASQSSAGSSTNAGSPLGAQSASSGKINLNTATSQQLETITGIGSTRAKAILEYREQHGPFQSVDDLVHVKGFGDKMVDSIRDQVVVQ